MDVPRVAMLRWTNYELPLCHPLAHPVGTGVSSVRPPYCNWELFFSPLFPSEIWKILRNYWRGGTTNGGRRLFRITLISSATNNADVNNNEEWIFLFIYLYFKKLWYTFYHEPNNCHDFQNQPRPRVSYGMSS